jgi:hypothetical protein
VRVRHVPDTRPVPEHSRRSGLSLSAASIISSASSLRPGWPRIITLNSNHRCRRSRLDFAPLSRPADNGGLTLVRQDLGVGEPRGVIDSDMGELPAGAAHGIARSPVIR